MILNKMKNIHASIKCIFLIGFLILVAVVTLYFIDSDIPKQSKSFRPQALGIDVSHYQGDINWSKVALSKISFAYAKATGGETYIDPKFQYNWHHIRTTNIHRGAYHFFFAHDSPEKQAEHFIKTVGELRKYDLPPMLDVEVADHESYKIVADRALIWLKEVEKSTKRIPIIYTDSSFGRDVLSNPEFSRYPLWIADYAPEIKEIPLPWKHSGWTIWQHSSEGVIKGVQGHVDLNRFHSDDGKLIRFIEETHTDKSFIRL